MSFRPSSLLNNRRHGDVNTCNFSHDCCASTCTATKITAVTSISYSSNQLLTLGSLVSTEYLYIIFGVCVCVVHIDTHIP